MSITSPARSGERITPMSKAFPPMLRLSGGNGAGPGNETPKVSGMGEPTGPWVAARFIADFLDIKIASVARYAKLYGWRQLRMGTGKNRSRRYFWPDVKKTIDGGGDLPVAI